MSFGSYDEFDSWPDPVLLVDSDGFIQHANPVACLIFDYSLKQFVGVPLRTLAPRNLAERQAWVKAMYSRASLDSNQPPGLDVTCVGKNGNSFPAYVTFENAPRHGEAWSWVMIDVNSSGLGDDSAPASSPKSAESDDGPRVNRLLVPPARSASGSLSQMVGSMKEFDSVFRSVSDELSKTIEFDSCLITLVDSQSGTITICHREVKDETNISVPDRIRGASYPIRGTIIEELLNSRSALLVTAPSGDMITRRYPGSVPKGVVNKYLSNIAVPVFVGDDIPGVLGVQSERPNAYTEEDVRFVSELAGVV